MKYSRRRFLAVAAGAGGLAAIGGAGWLRRQPAGTTDDLRIVRRSAFFLGSQVSITALHADEGAAARAVAAGFAELARIERVMSLYRPDSELCRLNRDGRLDRPDPCLVEVLTCAQDISRQSGGAFDVTVQPLWDLYASAKRNGWTPSHADIQAARAKVDWRRVEVAVDAVRLHGDGTAVTLNGLAQGFAADRVMAAIRAHGIEHALVDTGEIGSIGSKAGGKPWLAGVRHPRQPDELLKRVRLDGRCLSTSGDYATTFDDDCRSHHIFDPAKGRSPTELASVTVLARTGLQADALSTAVFVLGIDRGLALVRATPGADALLVAKDQAVLATEGFPIAS